MKTRITLTIDPRVSHRAKQLARQRNTSVSGLVEQFLREATMGESEADAQEKGSPSFSERWAGKVRLATKSDPRFRRLKSKYKR